MCCASLSGETVSEYTTVTQTLPHNLHVMFINFVSKTAAGCSETGEEHEGIRVEFDVDIP
jgi:hypothetical protein